MLRRKAGHIGPMISLCEEQCSASTALLGPDSTKAGP